MEPRLRTEIWVAAHLRRCEGEGAYALIARKGDPDAGAVAVKIYLGRGLARLLVQSRDLDGALVWRNPLAGDPGEDRIERAEGGPADAIEEARVDTFLEREAKIDPDLWVIEIEDRDGRAFLD